MSKKHKRAPRERRYILQVLNGPVYTEAERPPSWHNDQPLLDIGYSEGNAPDMERLPLTAFPLIDDFEIRLETMVDAQGHSTLGYHLVYFSPTLGYLAGFPWWDHVERNLQRDGFAVPLGDFDTPYSDVDQGWEIVIAERGLLVYVLEGRFDQRAVDGYHRWFKVLKERYLAQWQAAISASKQLSTTP